MKKPAYFLLLALIVALIASFGLIGYTSSAARLVKVGIYENAPKIFHDRDGQPAGLFIELLQEIASRERWTLQFIPCSWARCLELVETGEIDLMPDVAISEDRRQRFDFHTASVTSSWSQIYRHPNARIQVMGDLAGMRIAVVRDSVQQDYLADVMAGNKLQYTPVPVDSFRQGFDAVRQGRADAVVSNHFFGGRNASRLGLRETPIVFLPSTLYFATGKGRNGDLLAAIDLHLVQWRDNPNSVYFDAMKRTMVPPPVDIIPRWLIWALVSAATLMLLFFGTTMLLRWQVRQRTAELDRTSGRLDHMVSASPVILYRLQIEPDRINATWVSDNIERLFGYTPGQALAHDWWRSRLHPDDLEIAQANIARLQQHDHLVHEYRFFDAQNRIRYIRDELRLVRGAAGQPDCIVGSWSDLTDIREQTDQVSFLANHDSLTTLPNRSLLHARLSRSIVRAQQSSTQMALLHIDLDRFKTINDTLGHPVGDVFLREVARHLAQVTDPEDTVARIGGDAFVVLLANGATVHRTTDLARRILQLSSLPLTIATHQLVVTVSVGISLYPADGSDADTLLKHAELALYEAKNQGRNTFRFFASELSAGVLERLVMENSLRGAISRNELVLHYQPQVTLATGQLIGVEALVRWQHPEIGLVPPGQFIPLAEELGIIGDIGVWVLEQACRQMMAWQAGGLAVPRMAVNLSVRQIDRDELPAQLTRILHETGLEAARLELEVTESTIMREPDKAIAVLNQLKALGIKLAIDDFGTGHSSLTYLKRLPLDRLKIDQSFVRDIGHDINDEAISRTVINLARTLGLETVAEGVEREEQAAFLLREGCEIGQGYFYSKPLPAGPVLEDWMRERASGMRHGTVKLVK